MANDRRNPGLDALRVLAVALVLGVHAGQTAGLDRVTRFGANGVQLFFILSGYLGMVSLARGISVRQYYRGRAARILPLYWLILIVRYLCDFLRYLTHGMGPAAILAGPCGVRYLRYVFFLQMWLPSDDWMLWNNRNALWTMSSFALFYLLAPWLYRLIIRFRRQFPPCFALLLCCLAGKHFLGRALLHTLSAVPWAANVSEFSAKTPLMELYCFVFGMAAYFAVRESRCLFYGVFCAILPLLTGLQKMTWETLFVLLLLVVLRCHPAWPEPAQRTLSFFSAGSYFVYLVHPMLLGFFPVLAEGSGGVAWLYCLLVFGVCAGTGCLLYAGPVRRLERCIAQCFSTR
jgi:peptidoglycan/LPS O-acetylase OafA/YrhL